MHEVLNLYQGFQHQHYWNLGLTHPLLFALLCITGFMSIISGLNPVDTKRDICHDNQKCLQTMPNIHLGAISSLAEATRLDNVESRSELRDLTGDSLPRVSFCL